MPLEESFSEYPSIDEIQYGKEIADKIKATNAVPEQVAQRHEAYFKEIERPVSDFFRAYWGRDIDGIKTAVSDELRPDIAQEIRDEIAKIWA